MKEPILTILIIFILLGGIPTAASNGTAIIFTSIGSQSLAVTADALRTKEPASSTSMSDSTILLLFATGLMGLAGVSRENNSQIHRRTDSVTPRASWNVLEKCIKEDDAGECFVKNHSGLR
jgi:hypothetical protein